MSPLTETIELPWPPSVNSVYRTRAWIDKRTGKPRSMPILSLEGREYFKTVQGIIGEGGYKTFGDKRLKVEATFHHWDKRKRDLGNLDKVLMDSLEKARVFDNDEQIDDHHFIRGQKCKNRNARVVIVITEIPENSGPECSCCKCAFGIEPSQESLFPYQH